MRPNFGVSAAHRLAEPMPTSQFLTVAFYKFVDLPDFEQRRLPLLELCEKRNIKGLILLAREGINSTLAGTELDIRAVLAHVLADPAFADLQHKEAWATHPPFRRMKIRIKKEIVTMGVPGISPTHMAGTYVKPQDWNALISDPDVVLIDTRNDYEVELGTFKGALDPNIGTFSELPSWVAQAKALEARTGKKPKVAMFCTGGIRCEKAGPYMEQAGFLNVHQLDGGILKYFEECGGAHYDGECFVFDHRVGVDPALRETNSVMCFKCQMPLSENEQKDRRYVPPQSCPYCYSENKLSDAPVS